ncbi:hypothetical protein [Methylobacterium sp. WSM2598]|uniref:hypothetical protein n=1 Tax=Methylobacterium sp. WSM2598 TaxID=398261 RepID=UPI00036007AB|nr:hypothetical protein [Methylobacterium sp. WSM2598]
MVETSCRTILRRVLPPSLIVTPPPPYLLVRDEVQEALHRFAGLSECARERGEPELASLLDQVGLRAAARHLRMGIPRP